MLVRLMGFVLLGLIRVLTGSQARWYGCPPKAEQRIYFANHQSHADLVLIWAALPRDLRVLTRPIAARDYWTKTRFRQWITTEVFNAIYVSRERSADQDPLEPLIAALAQGDSIILFPEGTRGSAENPQAFHRVTMKQPAGFIASLAVRRGLHRQNADRVDFPAKEITFIVTKVTAPLRKLPKESESAIKESSR